MLFSKVKINTNFKICLYCINCKTNSTEGVKKQIGDMDLY